MQIAISFGNRIGLVVQCSILFARSNTSKHEDIYIYVYDMLILNLFSNELSYLNINKLPTPVIYNQGYMPYQISRVDC